MTSHRNMSTPLMALLIGLSSLLISDALAPNEKKNHTRTRITVVQLQIPLHEYKALTPDVLNLTDDSYYMSQSPKFGIIQVKRPNSHHWDQVLNTSHRFTKIDLKGYKLRYANLKETDTDSFRFRAAIVKGSNATVDVKSFHVFIVTKKIEIVNKDKIYVPRGSRITIGRSYLLAVSSILRPSQITYSIVNKPRHGRLTVNGTEFDKGFTQQQINSNLVAYESGMGKGYDMTAKYDYFKFKLGTNFVIEDNSEVKLVRILIQRNIEHDDLKKMKVIVKNKKKIAKAGKQKTKSRGRKRRGHKAFQYLKKNYKCNGIGWKFTKFGCFQMLRKKYNWMKARKECKKRGGDISVPMDGKYSKILLTITNNQSQWIGYRQLKKSNWSFITRIAPNLKWSKKLSKEEIRKQLRKRKCAILTSKKTWVTRSCRGHKAFAVCRTPLKKKQKKNRKKNKIL